MADEDGDTRNVVPPDPDVRVDSRSLGISPNGERLVAPCGAKICVWDTDDGSISDRFSGGAILAWSPKDPLIASTDGDANVVLIDADSGKHLATLSGHELDKSVDGDTGILHLIFSPDGSLLAFNNREDKDIVLWPTGGGEPRVFSDGLKDMPESLQFSPDGRFLYSIGGKDGIVKWDADDGTRLEQFELPDPIPSTSH